MKNAKMFSLVRLSPNSMVASVRLAYWLAERLGVPLTWEGDIADKPLDTLIIVNGAFAFCKYLPQIGQAVLEARRVIWVQNDYTIIPPKDDGDAQTPFRRAFVLRREQRKQPTIFWSTCEKWYALNRWSTWVNWNMLTFSEKYDERRIKQTRHACGDDLLYYGSWREGTGKSNRVPLFERYFRDPKVKTWISSPSEKFRNAYPKCEHMEPILEDFYTELGCYGMGLYIEDRKSSEEFHSPANRFYEMLSAGLPMVFMPECGSMMRKAGIDPTPYVAKNQLEIRRLMERREEIGEEQRRRWVPDRLFYHDKLKIQIDEAIRRLP